MTAWTNPAHLAVIVAASLGEQADNRPYMAKTQTGAHDESVRNTRDQQTPPVLSAPWAPNSPRSPGADDGVRTPFFVIDLGGAW